MSQFSKAELTRLHVENELLKFVDESHEMTRSDLQGRAHPVAEGIIDWVRKQPTGDGISVTLSMNEVDVILDRVNDWKIESKMNDAANALQRRNGGT